MVLRFLKEYWIGKKLYKENETVKVDDVQELNENYYIVILNGLRYDLKKDIVTLN